MRAAPAAENNSFVLSSLVPKLLLGHALCLGSSSFPRGRARQSWSFADKDIPKQELGNEEKAQATETSVEIEDAICKAGAGVLAPAWERVSYPPDQEAIAAVGMETGVA